MSLCWEVLGTSILLALWWGSEAFPAGGAEPWGLLTRIPLSLPWAAARSRGWSRAAAACGACSGLGTGSLGTPAASTGRLRLARIALNSYLWRLLIFAGADVEPHAGPDNLSLVH